MSFLNFNLCLKLALKSLLQKPFLRALIVVSVSVLIVIGAGLFELTAAFSEATKKIEASQLILAYLKPSVEADGEKAHAEVTKKITSLSGVSKVEYVDKTKFLEHMVKNFPTLAQSLTSESASGDSSLRNDVLADYFKITFNERSGSNILRSLKNMSEFEMVVSSSQTLGGLGSALKGFNIFLKILLVGVLLTVGCILLNHYKSGMDWSKQLKNTLGILGGKRSTVFGPFLVEGLIEGAAIGVLACLMWAVGVGFFNRFVFGIFEGAGYGAFGSEINYQVGMLKWFSIFMLAGFAGGLSSSLWLLVYGKLERTSTSSGYILK